MNQNARILLVDDEASIRLTLGALLERTGYDVTSADGGEQAVQLLERQAFDLLLTDLKMPGMDGMQVVAAARQCQPDVAVIVLTGHGSAGMVAPGTFVLALVFLTSFVLYYFVNWKYLSTVWPLK